MQYTQTTNKLPNRSPYKETHMWMNLLFIIYYWSICWNKNHNDADDDAADDDDDDDDLHDMHYLQGWDYIGPF